MLHLQVIPDFKYKPQKRAKVQNSYAARGPASMEGVKAGMSPISPLERAGHGSRAQFEKYENASPASQSPQIKNTMDNLMGKEVANSRLPEASSLLLNLILSDTILNVFRDHNFDSCTICVCSNEGNIRGRDAGQYIPNFNGGLNEDEVDCSCGFSALMNRKLAHQSGLFYEDETEITGITEDLYHRKKASLLLLDPKYNNEVHLFVCSIPGFLVSKCFSNSLMFRCLSKPICVF